MLKRAVHHVKAEWHLARAEGYTVIISTFLVARYMQGYIVGFYGGLKEARARRRSLR